MVDRDASCPMARAAAGVELVAAQRADALEQFLGGEAGATDAIVPSPLTAHLLFDWLVAPAAETGRAVRGLAPPTIAGIPWQRAGDEHTRDVSFATWTRPVNCIESGTWPHTRGRRTWSMPAVMRANVEASRSSGVTLDAALALRCTHRAFGVGMMDVSDE